MKLTVLSDNNTIIDRYLTGEPAVSYFIECGGKRILFDTGYSDVYIRNAAQLGIDLTDIDVVVLSHGHNDHTGGLSFFPAQKKKPELVAHPLVFEPRECDGNDAGAPVTEAQAAGMFELRLTDRPCEIAPSLFFLGEIERTNGFENKEPVGCRMHGGEKIPDYLPDDSALAFTGEEGLSIITGCSHAGICNIIEYAKKVTGEQRVRSVIGGFHLLNPASGQIGKTVDYLASDADAELYPCHCTCFEARAAIHSRVPVHEIGSGEVLEWK